MLNLDLNWQVKDFSPETADISRLSKPGIDTSQWHRIETPGDVNAVLVRDGRMPDPHIGDNARRCYWVSGKDWIYRSEFTVDHVSDGQVMIFDGIDGHTEIFLNGNFLGQTKNAFRPHSFPAGQLLKKERSNVLLIRFKSIDALIGKRVDDMGWHDLRVYMRKPQFNFGWDWALPLPSIGITGGVFIIDNNIPGIKDISVKPFVSGRLDFNLLLNEASQNKGAYVVLTVSGYGQCIQKRISRPDRRILHATLEIANPKLWWPNGMGQPSLYDWRAELFADGMLTETKQGRIGFREMGIFEGPFTEDAGPGISFWLTINRRKVFCKGANMAPFEIWQAEAREDQYRFYLDKAVEANFNMLRVWGGSSYERDRFYDLCDELGIMIWQDFMFAGADYPVDILREEIIAEAEYQVLRLRNHPCIALWCGGNENVYCRGINVKNKDNSIFDTDPMVDKGVYNEESGRVKVDRDRDDPLIYAMILRGTVGKHGLGVPFVESSPDGHEDWGGWPESGNSHVSSWKYALYAPEGSPAKFRDHFKQVCSFNSEFCIQGPCCLETLKRFIPPEHIWPPDEIWDYHIQVGHGHYHHRQIIKMCDELFGPITGPETFVKYGQAMHLELMRAEFENARFDRPNNGGTMVWMYNDCFPTCNWSIIDYYRVLKPAYFAAKRACSTYLPIIFERHGKVYFAFSNDGKNPVSARMTIGQMKLDGRIIWQKKFAVDTASQETTRFYEISRGNLQLSTGNFLFIDTEIAGERINTISYFPNLWRDIDWPESQPAINLTSQAKNKEYWETEIEILVNNFVRLCKIDISAICFERDISDNYFDVVPGKPFRLKVRSRKKIQLNDIHISSWYSCKNQENGINSQEMI